MAIASDHTGITLRRDLIAWLRGRGLAVADRWNGQTEPVDYPDVAAAVARAVSRGEADAGIVIDGAGIGSAIAANKLRGVRAAMATTETIARYSREHNGANVLTLGASLVTAEEARRDRRHVAEYAHARAAIHPPAGQDPRSGTCTVTRSELQRLIEMIVEEVAAASALPRSRCRATPWRPTAVPIASRACSTPAQPASESMRRAARPRAWPR